MLHIKDIALGYDGKKVLQLAQLDVAKGEECLLTGASGSGKTTLLFSIAGLLPVMGGSITLYDTDITTLSPAELDHFRGLHIGIVFQTLHLVPSLSVIDNLLLASYATGIMQDKVHAMALLHKLGLEDKAHALPETLSHGQAQRAAIARAVLHRPSLILADEPTSSLDDANCESVITLLKQEAKDSGATLIISTHDGRVKPHFKNVTHLKAAA